MIVILQKLDDGKSSIECRAVKHCSMLVDDVDCIVCEIVDLEKHSESLKKGAMPVGSVEFVKKAFEILGISIPYFDPYKFDMHNRKIKEISIFDLNHEMLPVFVKPVSLKQFNGFVFHGWDDSLYDDHDREQMTEMYNLPLCTKIYCGNVVKFIAEWRLYFCNGELLASCRYDDNDQEYIADYFISIVSQLVKDETLAIDIGLLDNGEFCIVEANDAWAIGKYKGISPEDYFKFLRKRWIEIKE